ncbi:hypothetical protein M5689_013658 [Euphorbia peplus]|nr:hypothetical protein M5689_013658 [Euphorbia peplus]
MDSFDDDPFHPSPLSLSSTTKKEDDEKVEENVENLLDEGWFYGKVLASSKPRGMLRCYSDPGQRISTDNPTLTTGNLDDKVTSSKISKLNRQFSDVSLVQKSIKEHGFIANVTSEEGRFPRQKVRKQHKLLRTPSLPSPCIAQEEEEDESDITMSRLIREAMPLSSQLLPPRSLSSKGMTQSYSIQKNRPGKNLKDMGYPNQRKLKKSLSVVEPEEVKGLKDLGLTNHQRGVKTEDIDKVKRRMYVAKTCGSPSPLIPIWANKNSAEDMMKLQIKYWARAVASKAR